MAGGDSDGTGMPLTDYEKQRLQNVQRNQAMLAALGIQHAASDMQRTASTKRAETKGYKRKAEKQPVRDEPVVTRRLRSSRVSWGNGEEAQEEEAKKEEASPLKASPTKAVKKGASTEPLALDDVHVQGDSPPSVLLSCLQNLEYDIPLSQLLSRKGSRGNETVASSWLTLKEEDIARVVPERIFSLAFLPVESRLVLLAGDKVGHLGFWDVDCDEAQESGVHIFEPHPSPVSGICIAPFSPSKIFTCSYDGTIKHLDIDKAIFDVVYCPKDKNLLTAMGCVPNSATCAYVGEHYGTLRMIDTRERKPTAEFELLHEKRINTIDFSSQSPWCMATSSTDCSVCIWDVRQMKGASSSIFKVVHKRAVSSAYFSPSGNSLATCSYDDTIAIVKGFQQNGRGRKPVMISHSNQNNRWVSSFRAIWGWDDEHVYVGNMKRTIDVISSSAEVICDWLSSPLMTSIAARLAAHPLRQGVLCGGTAGGQVYVWRK